MGKVYVIGTCDTKEAELRFAKACVEAAGVEALLVDVGTRGGSGARPTCRRARSRRRTRRARARCSAATTGGRRWRRWPRR
jgi:uncharacterized protein (UPF0261 family)